MIIDEYYDRTSPLFESVPVCQMENGRMVKTWKYAILEHTMDVCIQDAANIRFQCTPQYLAKLVIGYMLSSGIIRAGDEIERICIYDNGKKADVILKKASPDRMLPGAEESLGAAPISWEREWIYCLADTFSLDMPLHAKTGAAHISFLMSEGKIIFQCEDIGRYNALDKAVGFGIRCGIDLKKSILFTSGRMPAEMVMKAVYAGIPMLAGRSVPTKEAVDTARRYGLTLIGKVKGSSMVCYT